MGQGQNMKKARDKIYVGQMFYTKDGDNFEILSLDKKVGITCDVDSRAKGLTGTNSPFVWIALRAWRSLDGSSSEWIEEIIHNMMRSRRITGLTRGKKSEWFVDEEEVLLRDVTALLDSDPRFVRVDGFEHKISIPSGKENPAEKVRRNFNQPQRANWAEVLEGRTFSYHVYDHNLFMEVKDGETFHWIEGEERSSGDIRSVHGNLVRTAHNRGVGIYGAKAGGNLWKMKDVETGEVIDDLLKEAYNSKPEITTT